MPDGPTNPIDVDRALSLYDQLHDWNLVGKALAKEKHRNRPWQGESIKVAVHRSTLTKVKLTFVNGKLRIEP